MSVPSGGNAVLLLLCKLYGLKNATLCSAKPAFLQQGAQLEA